MRNLVTQTRLGTRMENEVIFPERTIFNPSHNNLKVTNQAILVSAFESNKRPVAYLA